MDIIPYFLCQYNRSDTQSEMFYETHKNGALSLFGDGEYLSFQADNKDTTHDIIFVIHLPRPTPW